MISSADPLLVFLILAAGISAVTAWLAGRATTPGRAGLTGCIELLAAGLLLAVLALHLLPQALTAGPGAGAWFLAGFLAAALMHSAAHAAGRLAVWAGPALLAIHSFSDGAIHVKAALHLSWAALPGLVLHELPETLAAFVLLRRAGLAPSLSAAGAFAIAGLATALSGAAFDKIVHHAKLVEMTALSAASAGLLLQIVTGHLLRPLENRPSAAKASALTLGLAAGLGASVLSGAGGHAHHHVVAGPDFRPVSTIQERDR